MRKRLKGSRRRSRPDEIGRPEQELRLLGAEEEKAQQQKSNLAHLEKLLQELEALAGSVKQAEEEFLRVREKSTSLGKQYVEMEALFLSGQAGILALVQWCSREQVNAETGQEKNTERTAWEYFHRKGQELVQCRTQMEAALFQREDIKQRPMYGTYGEAGRAAKELQQRRTQIMLEIEAAQKGLEQCRSSIHAQEEALELLREQTAQSAEISPDGLMARRSELSEQKKLLEQRQRQRHVLLQTDEGILG